MGVTLRRGLPAPLLAGGATALVMLAVFGSLRASPAFHDETAYLLQAKIFESGRWTAAARPMPEFFQEIHSFDTPVVASKYWPGHSLALVPGVALGLPALVPVLLAGIMGAFLYALARRSAGSLVALLAWLVWISAPDTLYFGPTYFSELTTGAVLLVGWWALLEYHEGGPAGWLLLLAFCFGWGAITRPLTMFALAVPAGWVLVKDVARRHAWQDLAAPALVASACLAVVPWWSQQTLGDWRKVPYTEYARLYLPIDRMGFGTDTSAPVRPMPPDLAEVSRKLTEAHREHTLATIPGVLGQRLYDVGKGMWGGERVVLLPFAVLSVGAWPMGAGFACASAAVLVLAYLLYAVDRGWTVYYFELLPILAFVTAVGLVVAGRWLIARLRSSAVAPSVRQYALPALAAIYGAGSLLHLAGQVGLARAKHAFLRKEQVVFRKALAPIKDHDAVVFIRYAASHSPHLSLIDNGPDLDRVRIWKVYDRGSDNARLMRQFPSRSPYLYDEPVGSVRPLTP